MADKAAPVEGFQIEQGLVEIAFIAVRREADASAYGSMISDDVCRQVAVAVVTDLENYRKGKDI